MKKTLFFSFLFIWGMVVKAVQLSGAYTIDATQPASATNFQNFNSAITYLTTANPRSDGGPSNSAPFGVSGPVTFNVVASSGPYNEQIQFVAVPGASLINTITFEGNNNIISDTCTTAIRALVRLDGADFIRLRNLTIRPMLDASNVGWGIQFLNNADSNVVENCLIDIGLITSTGSTNSAGIVFSASLTSPTSTGTTGRANLIQGNTIKGGANNGGMYYGIVGSPSTSAANITANRFINNIIEDFYYCGFYWGNSNRTMFRGNQIRRPAKTSSTTAYGIYLFTSHRADTFEGNRITNFYGGMTTNGNAAYGIWGINSSGTTTEPNVFFNNLIKFNNGEGSHYGIYYLTGFNNRFYNNTISLEFTSSTSSFAQTYGFYWAGGTSASSTLDFRNNIISITRGGTGQKVAVFGTGSWASGATLDKNGYFGNAQNYVTANYLNVNYATYSQYRAAIATQDQNSSDFNPNFVSVATNDYAPQEAWYNANGAAITGITTDINGVTRTLPLDIGAFEASPILLDVAASRIILPATPYTAGAANISAEIRNAGATTITSATINWTVNGVAQTPINFTGTLNAGAVSAPILLGSITTIAGRAYTIQFTVDNPNNTTDGVSANNSTTAQTAPVLTGGVYTLNAAGTGATNFTSLVDFANVVSLGGISGAITLNVTAGSGPYVGQVFFNAVQGASATNTITINGNGERVEFNNTNASSLGIINLIGADYITFNNLGVRSLNTSNGVGYLLTAGADFNNILNCNIDISSVTGSSNSAGVALTAGTSSPVSQGNNGTFLRIENNTIIGNASGGPFYGISVMPVTISNPTNNGIIVRNNIIRDFTSYGIYMAYTGGSSISGNRISRPSRNSSSTVYGIYGINAMAQDTIENNFITQPFEALQTTTAGFYGMYFIGTNVQSTRQVLVRNNVIADIRSNGLVSGIYMLSASNFRFYNNTIVVDHPTSTATQVTYLYYNTGTPTTQTIRNNIFVMNRGGSGSKYLIYLATTSATGYVINNNVLHYRVPAGSTNNFTGFYSTNQLNLTAWRTVNSNAFDQNSVDANPQFRTQLLSAPFTPGADSINNIGANLLTEVPADITGAPRTITPDPGAYEFVTSATDAGLTRFTNPVNPITLGSNNIDVVLRNFGTSTLSSANIDWTVDNTAQTGFAWTGSLNANDTSIVNIGTYNFVNPGIYTLRAWSSQPNATTDILRFNDTISMTFCTPLTGTYTINATQPASSTNFTSFTALGNMLANCGISGNLTVNVAPGVYNEQFVLANIPGLGNGNRIEFIGADSGTTRLVFNATNTNFRYTMLIQGADNLSFSNIRFEALNASLGTAVQITGDATTRSDSLSFVRCTFMAPLSTSSSVNPLVVSSSNTAPTSAIGQNATNITIDSCSIVGGFYGACMVSSAATRGNNIFIRNSLLKDGYVYNSYFSGFENIVFERNIVTSTGRAQNYSFGYGFFGTNIGTGITIEANTIQNMLGGYGIYITTSLGASAQNRNRIVNNAIQIGEASNLAYGMFLTSCGNYAVVNNSINVTSASSTATCFYLSSTNASLYNTVDVINNIFQNKLQGYVIWLNDGGGSVTGALLQPVNWEIDHNNYVGLSAFPYRSNNFINGTLAGYIGLINIASDSFSVTIDPLFASPTNLRTTLISLNNIGRPNPWALNDIDGTLRGVLPDLGINEFTPPPNDAGIVTILTPAAPVQAGLTDVRVIVRNFGAVPITSVDVTYSAGTTIHTQTFTNTIPSNGQDTVTFSSTSGPSGSSQQFNYTGNSLVFAAYTSNPNTSADGAPANDTLRVSLCGALNGTYTINPTGTGATNFTNFASAIAALNCGGVSGPVQFLVSNGTYTEQLNFGIIPGASAVNTIRFTSASNNRNNVTVTFIPTSAATNYVVNFAGTRFVFFENMTFTNTSTSFGRVFHFNLGGVINSGNIGVRNCNVNGSTAVSTSDVHALFFSATGTHIQNVTISNNNLTNGSAAVFMGGQAIINQYSGGLVVDSNVFAGQYYYGLYLTQRLSTKIRNNIFNMPSTVFYGIFISSSSNELEIANNRFTQPTGYGIYVSTHNQYGEPFGARIYNNAINLNSSGSSGIYMTSCSNFRIYNNSINIVTTSTSTALGGIYMSGLTTALPQVGSTQIYCYNNAIHSSTLPSLVIANVAALTATQLNDYNVYFSTGTNIANINNTLYTVANFNTIRNMVHAGSDINSFLANPTFTSTLAPDVANAGSWVLNGRGIQEFGYNRDINGNFRSDIVTTGAPDIGAFEFTPTALPPVATVVGTIGYGQTQSFVSFGDTIGSITWGFGGTLPTTITARFAPGTLISNRASSPNSNALQDTAAHLMDAYWTIGISGGSGYSYDVRLRYKPTQIGNIPTESDIKFANRLVNGQFSWWNNNSFMTVLDTVNNVFGINSIFDPTSFTATTDLASPLPVKLRTFNATKLRNDVNVNWVTVTERNASHFIIERSLTGRNFEAVGRVKATGNTSLTVNYNFTDLNVAAIANNGTVYYRLKIIDKDGRFEYSPIVSVSFGAVTRLSAAAYPNPFNDLVSLKVNAIDEGYADVEVVDVFGKRVQTNRILLTAGENNVVWDNVSTLNKGIYFVRITMSGEEQVLKLIKE